MPADLDNTATLQCVVYTLTGSLIPGFFVSSIYIQNPKYRDDHPLEIKRRFQVVGVACSISAVITYSLLAWKYSNPLEIMGVHLYGTIAAAVIPTLHTAVFYIGTLLICYLDGSWQLLFSAKQWRRSFKDIIWLKHIIVGPLLEEIAFRACTAALFLHCFRPWVAIVLTPLFFASSHMHHLISDIQDGLAWKSALNYRLVQFGYTYLFGVYATYVFTQTGHLIAPVMCHALCNTLGVPAFAEVSLFPARDQKWLWGAHVAGMLAFVAVLPYALDSSLYTFI
uniref:CAAX prenyl protease 2 n=1 Tax=Panagrellus redivivus TaxID=6233 RepID=A0A7E4VM72_PANRE